jgi:hypothetical protein
MNKAELQLQEKIVIVFEELNDEVKKMSSKLYGLGWAAKCSFRVYVNSDYQNPEKYDAANLAWRKANAHEDLLKWLIQLLDTHKNFNGYFANYNQFIKELDDGIAMALKMKAVEKADILIFWWKKLPIPDDLETTVYKFLPMLRSMKTGHDYIVEFQTRFEMYSDDKLLEAFNGYVNSGGSSIVRFYYGVALHHEFIRRGYDYSAVGDSASLSFRDKIRLENRTILKIKPSEINDPGV